LLFQREQDTSVETSTRRDLCETMFDTGSLPMDTVTERAKSSGYWCHDKPVAPYHSTPTRTANTSLNHPLQNTNCFIPLCSEYGYNQPLQKQQHPQMQESHGALMVLPNSRRCSRQYCSSRCVGNGHLPNLVDVFRWDLIAGQDDGSSTGTGHDKQESAQPGHHIWSFCWQRLGK